MKPAVGKTPLDVLREMERLLHRQRQIHHLFQLCIVEGRRILIDGHCLYAVGGWDCLCFADRDARGF